MIRTRTVAKALLNRVEVRGIRWEEDKEGPLALNDLTNCMNAMNSAVVENNDTSVLRISVHLWKLASISEL
jgi:hypothetical protein